MKYRKLGRTELSCSVIGFGCWGLGGVAYGPISYKTSKKILDKSYERGLNFFDTSDLYGSGQDGRSEKILGNVFEKKRDKVILATKFGLLPHDGWYMPEKFSLSYLNDALEKSLTRLRTDYIDLIQLHSPSTKTLKNRNKMSEIISFLKKKKKEGKIRYFGVSLRSPIDAFIVLKNYKSFHSIQTNFNIIDQRILENNLIGQCKKLKVGIIARTPLVYGYLTGKINEKKKLKEKDHRKKWNRKQLKIWSTAPKIFDKLVKNDKMTMAQFCLSFCSSFDGITTTIPGMMSLNHVKENLKVSNFKLFNKKEKDEIFEIYKTHSWINLTNKKNVQTKTK